MVLRCLLPLVLLLVLNGQSRGADQPIPRPNVERLFVSGETGYGRYRIPAIYVTPKQTILAFCEGRVKPSGLTGDIDLVLRRSTDGGKTWTPLQVVADDGPNTLGNPCPVVDWSTGTIWLLLSRSRGEDTETQITEGTSKERTQVWVTKSTDEGLTWDKPVNISAQATLPQWTWYGPGPGIGLQLPSGRLFIPAYHAVEKTGIYQVHSLYSDDHGQTWKIGGTVADETTEAQAALRADGTLVINTRNISPRDASIRNRAIALSRDEGLTWTDVGRDAALTESSCQGSLIVYSGLGDGAKSRWLFANPPGPGRRQLTLRLSYDEGRTWARSLIIEPGAAEYSGLAKLPNGEIGLLYERNTQKKYAPEIVFTRLTLSEIEGP